MEIKEKSLDLKLNKGHAVCFDFDGVIHIILDNSEED